MMTPISVLAFAALVGACVTDVTDEASPDFDLDGPALDEGGSGGKADSASTTTVFLNFGGGRIHSGNCSDAPSNCSSLVAGTQDLAPFTVSADWDRPKVVAAITRCVGMFYDDMDVRFVTTRPDAGPYTMMMIGAIYPTQLGFAVNGQGPYGRAPVDCNGNKNDIGFLLLEDDLNPDFYYMCRSIAHEVAHTFGMVHTTGENTIANGRVDVMCESGECGNAAANGSVKWDTINRSMPSEVRACDGTTRQNTYARLMETLGVKR